jgi:nucleotide-binding universal stress UspA family protein
MGYSNILITLDGSPLAEHAIDYALMAAAPGARLHLLSIVEELTEANAPLVTALNADYALQHMQRGPSTRENIPHSLEVRYDYVNVLKDAVTNQGYEASVDVRQGPVVQTVLEAAPEVEIVVMASHGRTGLRKLVLGSVTEAVLHRITRPLLITPPHPRQASPGGATGFDNILVSLDGSAQSEAILPEVEKLLSSHPGRVVLLRVAPQVDKLPEGLSDDEYTLLSNAAEWGMRKYLDAIGERLAEFGATPIIEANFNGPREEICFCADYYRADLIAMGTHGRTGISRLLHGSVTEHVLHRAHRPMLIVRVPGA